MEQQTTNQAHIDNLIESGYHFDLGECISKGWEIFKLNAGSFIGYTVIYFIIITLVGYIPFIGAIGNFLIAQPLVAGFFLVAKKVHKGERHVFGDFFNGFDFFGPLMLYSLIGTIFIIIGMFLLVIPGLYLAIAYSFVTPFIIFAKMDFWNAMETSRKLITTNWFSFFGFVIVLVLINILGLICLGVGILVTIPLTYCAIYAAYDSIVGVEEQQEGKLDEATASQLLDA